MRFLAVLDGLNETLVVAIPEYMVDAAAAQTVIILDITALDAASIKYATAVISTRKSHSKTLRSTNIWIEFFFL